MGIDPVTHEPFHKETKAEESNSSQADNLRESSNHQMVETDPGNNNLEENSRSPTENSSNDDSSSSLLENLCSDDSILLNSLWMDEPALVDATWNNIPPAASQNINDIGIPSWEDNSCSWLLDCQDFGIHDFGFDCFSDNIELNTLNTLEMGDKH